MIRKNTEFKNLLGRHYIRQLMAIIILNNNEENLKDSFQN